MARTRNRFKRLRRKFGKIKEISEIPNLLAIQRRSYEFFLNSGEGDSPQQGLGLRGAFDSVFPIRNPDGSAELEFLGYEVGDPHYDADECRMRDLTYGAPLKATFRLNSFEVEGDTGLAAFKHSKDQTVHLGDLPMMTETGTFVVNGAERVVVSQLHRSPGVYFDHDSGRKSASGKPRYLARVIPYRGFWLEFEFDSRDRIHFKVDRDVKMPVTTLLYAFGMNRERICRELYPTRRYRRQWDSVWTDSSWTWRGRRAPFDLVDPDSGEVAVHEGEMVGDALADKLAQSSVKRLARALPDGSTGELFAEAGDGWTAEGTDPWSIQGRLLSFDLVDADSGEVKARGGELLTRQRIVQLERDDDLKRLVNGTTQETVAERGRYWTTVVDLAARRGRSLDNDLVDAATGEVVVEKGGRVTDRMVRQAPGGFTRRVEMDYLLGRPAAVDIVDPATGVVLVDAAGLVTQEALAHTSLDEIEMLELPEGGGFVHAMIALELVEETRLRLPNADDRNLALFEIYRSTRSSEAPSLATAEDMFEGMFRDSSRYDLSSVGRAKIRERLGVSVFESERSLNEEDVAAVVRELESLLMDSRGRQHERMTEKSVGAAVSAKVAEWLDGGPAGKDRLPEKAAIALARDLEHRFGLSGIDGLLRAEIHDRLGRRLSRPRRLALDDSLDAKAPQNVRERHERDLREREAQLLALARELEYRYQIPGIARSLETKIDECLGSRAASDRVLREDDVVETFVEHVESCLGDESPAAKAGLKIEGVKKDVRAEINRFFGRHLAEEERELTGAEIEEIVQALPPSSRRVDDIDHLGNRRVRSVGELIEQQYRFGLMRMERAVRERIKRITPAELEQLKPEDLINARVVVGAVKEFLASSQLSQFMDQTNPLSEMAHKRRISALGPRGLKRRNAGFEVRDVHRTHYGRICPIETPEGANIGLVNSFATFAQVNPLGFIETPFREVEEGRVTDRVIYLSAMEEIGKRIAQANEPLASGGKLEESEVLTRSDDGRGELFEKCSREEVDLIDVSPKQVVSVSASLIPFLENDDANRALMGSNMQRQAVPLIETEAPFVGTGIEDKVARDCGSAITVRRGGVIDQVDASRIVVRVTGELEPGDLGVDIYRLQKFQRSNQNTAINHRPLVKKGERVDAGDVIADGPSTDNGELALGRNVLVAFMPWQGYNFEDSVLVSARVVREAVFTSINIERFETSVRDTKLGPEAITRELPNVSEDALRNLDEAGIVYIGAEVDAGDILVGKITPKGETPMTPEEKLLRAIFGEKASEVRDTSLRLPPGDQGTVVEVRIFTRENVEPDQRARQIAEMEMQRFERDRVDEQKILDRNIAARLRDLLAGQTASKASAELEIKKGEKLEKAALANLDSAGLFRQAVGNAEVMERIERLHKEYKADIKRIEERFQDRCVKIQQSDNLQAGVIKVVKVFVAVKRRLQPGDKMAGRHGNKGVISRVLPEEDMPFLADGTPVDIVLNPLGVPSRMNVGQILETHLGWAAYGLGRMINKALEAYRGGRGAAELRRVMGDVYGKEAVQAAAPQDGHLAAIAEQARGGVHFATPVFDGARAEDISDLLEKAGLDRTGQEVLYDGRTGLPFDRRVTVGYKYMMKLHHLVDNKIHARSTGPYSLVTQQPVRGKARFGGQRVGEMEVWALQAYGAAHTLREILTYKSDDVAGRAKAYEAMAKGENNFEAGRPESFNVLVSELKALGLNVELQSNAPPARPEDGPPAMLPPPEQTPPPDQAAAA